MDFIPTGSLSLELAHVAYCIARCPVWHTWTGVDELPTAAERFDASLEKVHISGPPPAASPDGYTREELETLRPYAVVTNLPPAVVGPSREMFIRQRMAHEHFGAWHQNYIQIVSDIPEDLALLFPKNHHHILNRLSELMDQMLEQSGIEGDEDYPMPFIQRLALLDGPTYPDEKLMKVQGYYSMCILRIESGLRR